jgi:hypothetical protein
MPPNPSTLSNLRFQRVSLLHFVNEAGNSMSLSAHFSKLIHRLALVLKMLPTE